MRTLFMQAPSYDGFDGGAGSRYQARREIKSYWYPTWLAQLAAMVPNSKLIDAAPHGIGPDEVGDRGNALRPCRAALLDAVLRLRRQNRRARSNRQSPASKSAWSAPISPSTRAPRSRRRKPSISSPARTYDFTIRDVAEGRDWKAIAGLIYRDEDGAIRENEERPMLEDMDQLPFVTPVYKRDLRIENYFIGYLKHPYISFYTGRGCKSRCTFCLWPQTVGGHSYRTRSVENVDRRDRLGPQGHSRRSRNSSSTTIPSPTTCRAPRRSRASSASWA